MFGDLDGGRKRGEGGGYVDCSYYTIERVQVVSLENDGRELVLL